MGVLTPGSMVGGTYRVVRRVGTGGMGQVYEATHARLAGRYAIKVLQPQIAVQAEALERFRREAEITSSLRHPNIVHIMDFNRLPDGSPYLVMEYLEGADLGARLEQTGPPPLDEVVILVGQIASALQAAHTGGVVHRDLKPQNVCLVPLPGQGRAVVKVVDFGMSKIRSAAGQITGERAILGTCYYMSPEQALGKIDEIDARTDQFALAVMAYEMLTGRSAFVGENDPAVLYQVVHTSPPPLVLAHPATPSRRDALAAVIERALQKDKSKRYPSVLEFAQAFEGASGLMRGTGRAQAIFDAREGVPLSTAPSSSDGRATVPDAKSAVSTWTRQSGERVSRSRRRPRWPALVAALALIAGAAAFERWRRQAAEGGAPVGAAPAPVAPVPPAVAPPPPAPPSPTVLIELEGLPEGAQVQWDGRSGSARITFDRGPASHHLKVEAAGFLPYESEVVPDRDRTIVLALERAPEPPRDKRPSRRRSRAAAPASDGESSPER
jgi:serine/threonine-protein kinase